VKTFLLNINVSKIKVFNKVINW
ncbi:uncharacterized protein METZ01_LOCUS430976, partial [marine metagenome]